jgi:CubicO group peptidase (beta-lactamase class C family)
MTRSKRPLPAPLLALALLLVPSGAAAQSGAPIDPKVYGIFAGWSAATPGCAVAVSVGDEVVFSKAYGMADLEHDVRNTPETIFEAGSVSKQFTAAAVLLLARDGKLSLDDPVRKYIPELPDYGVPLTIRHMLNHTSGLRDWGNVAAIAGWERTSRVHTHAHVLDIVARQRALNFTPGTRWSYSNTGYNLAAILVARVSGVSFQEFCRRRIFEPLGMTRTQWRDDHTRIVKGRAVAYSSESDRFHSLMPFENVHGNGGLLTTVGDLLRWNRNFASPRIGDASFVGEQETPGKFSDGRSHNYGLGLRIGTYRSLREVSHSGATAGYRAHLARFPERRLSVAVLCNATTGAASRYAQAVADLYLGDLPAPTAPRAAHTLTREEGAALAGLYRDRQTGLAVKVVAIENRLRAGTTVLVPISSSTFVASAGDRWEFTPAGARKRDAFGSEEVYERAAAAVPAPSDLLAYVGTYVSSEAETTFTVAVEQGSLVLRRRPDTRIVLTPLYPDAFEGPGTVIFRRDAAGRASELSIVQDRVWDLRFIRQEPKAASQ